ncbi:vesicle-associated membrane protein 4 isoform X2 [Microtus ochrogaster]|nr:vesicle-associated membrane protein 4 isoform X2 [Microtus ochrogaster]
MDEVIDVMQENITKVIERGERLDELQDKSESLSDNATAFSNRSKQLRRQMWWRGCKIKAIMALAAAILLLMIIIDLMYVMQASSNGTCIEQEGGLYLDFQSLKTALTMSECAFLWGLYPWLDPQKGTPPSAPQPHPSHSSGLNHLFKAESGIC